jgi:outer membrane protein assembly factor BamB
MVIAATESNLVYALDADTGAVIWQTQLAPAAPLSALGCGNIDPEGVTGTPVIDPASGTLYLDAMTIQGRATPRQMLYALSLETGKVLPNWPLDVQKAMGARHAPFSSTYQGDRGGLQFFGGNLYMTYAGRYGDCGPYRGTVIEVSPVGAPAITGSWSTRAHGGGVWAQGGVSTDGVSLFATTGNTFSNARWVDGEAIIRLQPGLARSTSTQDYFTPANWKTLDNEDLDLGGTQALPLDVPSGSTTAPRMLALGKDGNAYLVNRGNLGGIGGQLQIVKVSNTVIITAPAVYNTAAATLVSFTNYADIGSCGGNAITTLRVTPSAISTAWCASFSGGGAPIITTTNGSADPIVWVAGAEGDNLLHGFEALTGKVVFNGTGTSMSGLRHLGTILSANQRLYVAADGKVYAFVY